MADETRCNSCDSSSWSSCKMCAICQLNCCDICALSFGHELICERCQQRASEALDAVRPDLMEAVLDWFDARGIETPEEPVSIQCLEALGECKSVSEVAAVMTRHSKVLPMPVKRDERRAA